MYSQEFISAEAALMSSWYSGSVRLVIAKQPNIKPVVSFIGVYCLTFVTVRLCDYLLIYICM